MLWRHLTDNDLKWISPWQGSAINFEQVLDCVAKHVVSQVNSGCNGEHFNQTPLYLLRSSVRFLVHKIVRPSVKALPASNDTSFACGGVGSLGF